jgi:hypothetical protein
MRQGLFQLVSATMLASMAIAACSSSGGAGGAGGSSSSGGAGGTGGSSSSGGTGGGASPVTSLTGSKAVNALTPVEATQLCNDTYAYFGSAIPKATTCKWKALTYGASSSAPDNPTLQQKCTTQETACTQGGDPWATNSGCNDIPATCTATVAEYSACISDEVAVFIQSVNGFPMCASLVMSNVPAIMDAEAGGNTPASCTSLGNKCPDLTAVNPLIPQ